MASESQSGDTFVYKKTILNTLLLLGIAITMLVFGAGILKESLQKPKRKKSKPTRSGRARDNSSRSAGKRREPASSPQKKTGGILVGAGLLLGGVLILLLGVPSSLVQHITVTPDKVEMRISTLWFASGTREIPYSQISGIEKIEADVMARRGKRKKETLILYHEGGTEFIEMGPMERAAFPKLVEMYDAYRESQRNPPENTDIAQNEGVAPAIPPHQQSPHQPPIATNQPKTPPFGGANNFPKTTSNEGSLTPVSHLGRMFPGGSVSVRDLNRGGFSRATILEVYSEGKLKVVPLGKSAEDAVVVDVADTRPGGSIYMPPEFGPGIMVDQSNPPAPGSRVLAPFAGRWFEVELVSVSGSSARVQWKAEKAPNFLPTRSLRIVPTDEIKNYDGKRYNPKVPPANARPVDRLGIYAKGKEVYFKEGGSGPPRKVRILQPYNLQMIQVQDSETSEILYVFVPELQTSL